MVFPTSIFTILGVLLLWILIFQGFGSHAQFLPEDEDGLTFSNCLLKGLNLTGTFPDEFGNLTHLQELDLTRNHINGQLPTSLANAPLVKLSLLGNRLNGSIPKEIGDIGTLEELVLRNCLINGSIPQYIGEMNKLSTLFLTNNSLSGEVPGWILRSKKNIDLSYNNFSGSTLASCQQSPVNLVASYPPTANHQ
ncbi:putative LRR receptor-like serine/threonine-protein kinase [Cucurbita argyrosperma subsp. argyrosperma]|nr:putative LRR receptor-like serine/threonine-protein kinase [Cucurbita argyrosperma subsp. argyrosperma]